MNRNKNFCFLFISITSVHKIVIILFSLLNKTGDAHKIRMLSHTIFTTFKKCNRADGNIVKNDGGSEMVVVFTITEIN